MCIRVFYVNVHGPSVQHPVTVNPQGRASLAGLMVLIGALGMTAIWGTAAVMTGRPLGWLALLTAADLALLAHLAGAPAGRTRAAYVLLGLTATTVASNFLLSAGMVGQQVGLSPLQSAPRLSLDLAWLLAVQSNGPLDMAAIAAAFGLAWWWAR